MSMSGKEIYVKNGNKYVALGSVIAGRLKFTNGNTLDIGNIEEIFDAELTDSDKNLMQQMHIDFSEHQED